MRSHALALVLSVATLSSSARAFAQQGDPAAAGSVTGTLPPTGATTSAQAAPMPSSASTSSAEGYRPTPLTLGIGFGWLIGAGANILQPSVGSVRFMFSDTFILEPFVNLSLTKTQMETTVSTTDTDVMRAGAGATGRFLLGARGPIDLAVLGQLRFQYTKTDTGTVDTDELNVAVNWGLGLSWWFYKTWAMSLDATNPLFSWRRTHTDPADTTRTEIFTGAVFNPQVLLILHMFF